MSVGAEHGGRRFGAGFALLSATPVVWSLHFLACYVTAAIWCAKAPVAPEAGLGWVPAAVGIYTVAALLALGAIGVAGWEHARGGGERPPREDAGPSGRRRFVGRATVLVTGLGVLATLLVAIVVVLAGSCR